MSLPVWLEGLIWGGEDQIPPFIRERIERKKSVVDIFEEIDIDEEKKVLYNTIR